MKLDDIRCLSIRQPWAYLILHCGKDVENRRWRRGYRGPVLIHAGIAVDRDAMSDPALRPMLRNADLQMGGIVGACIITGCVAESDSAWFFGPYALTLERAVPLPFIPMPGRLYFFPPTPEALAAAMPGLGGLLRGYAATGGATAAPTNLKPCTARKWPP